MKITKFVHSCVMVEMPDRTAIFDPGVMSEQALDVSNLEYLDDIFITHVHPDHMSTELLKKLVDKFPDVRITTTIEAVEALSKKGIKARAELPDGVALFDSPHEDVKPMFPSPQQIGIHYLDKLSDPGDSHSFNETKDILLMPVTAPWGTTVKAINKIIELKPKHVIPIHDWHWNDQAREISYGIIENIVKNQGIEFHKPVTGQSFNIDI